MDVGQSDGGVEDEGLRWAPLAVVVYIAAFLTGAIVMSFEMLGSRYLAPYFGNGIYTWAALISTVLAALCIGYFLGGSLADRHPSPRVLAVTVAIGSVYLLLLPAFADPVLQFFVNGIDDIKLGSLASALAIMLFPVTLLGVYSPFAIRLLMRSQKNSGMTSGTVYGVSTAGSIIGTLGTTFFLIPLIGSRAITLMLGVLGLLAAALLMGAAGSLLRRSRLGVIAFFLLSCAFLSAIGAARAEEPFDASIRTDMRSRKNGLVAHIETVYNDVFVGKYADVLKMAFQWKGWEFQESEVNLADPDDLPLLYMRVASLAAIYPQDVRRVLVLGVGGGAMPVYFHRFLPDAMIEGVELDPGVIDTAKKYFGLRETSRFRLIESDGRVFLNRHKDLYDIIVVDAYTGSYIPFHMMTKEFYKLVRDHLAPHGVAAMNIIPSEKLYESNVRTLLASFDHLDFYNSGDAKFDESNVLVFGRLDALTDTEIQQKASAAQERYKFRFNASQLVTARRIETPKVTKGDVLTDDFAPANVLDVYGRRYHRQSEPDESPAYPPQK
jgi:spermidine synthase